MTEADWLTPTTDRGRKLFWLGNQVSQRRYRLFACACCRQIWDELAAHSRAVIEVAERHADGLEADAALEATHHAGVRTASHYLYHAAAWSTAFAPAVHAAVHALRHIECSLESEPSLIRRLLFGKRIRAAVDATHTSLLRCIFGNPFRPVAFDPRWRTETAVSLASGIYYGRHFDRLPILADSLEDAGCDAAELLAHLRGPGPHARGCWPLDLVLGK